jgi:hypothetical protein
MSTLRTGPVNRCPGGDALVSLLYDDFEPGAAPTRSELEAHVLQCETCATEFESLGGVRANLAAWEAPEVELGFAVVRTGSTPSGAAPLGWRQTFTAWSARSGRTLAAAAAAVVVLGGAAALARLDVRYDAAGLSVRTGWGHATPGAAAPTTGAQDADALRRELAALRSEVTRLGARATPVAATSLAPVTADPSTTLASSAGGAGSPFTAAQGDELFRRLRRALDESEVRQQQNLQLRIGEVTREFDLQRRQDLVQVEQGFGRLNTERQQMMDLIRRASFGQVPQQ